MPKKLDRAEQTKRGAESSAARRVAIICDGERIVHAVDTTGNYATLCGMDGNDPHGAVSQSLDRLKGDNEKITCRQCWAIWAAAKQYRRTDFKP